MPTEFKFLENLRRKYSLTKIGDDCAVLPKDAFTDLVITTDLLVEDIDFRLDWTKPQFIGHKALAVSLSDVAAMGAKPVWSMVSIGVPEKIWRTDFVDKFYEGYMEIARMYGVELVGGDVSRTPDKIIVDSIVAGEVAKGKAVLRSGAKPGDLICVTGSLGAASAGLKILESGVKFDRSASWQIDLIDKQLLPYPCLRVVNFTKPTRSFPIPEQSLENITAMIDISDGLISDLFHICRASKVGAKIFAEKIPLHKRLRGMTKVFEGQLEFALNGGEDFELLFTVNPKKIFQLEKALENRQIFRIGEVTANEEMIELITPEKSEILEPKGFRHF